MAVSMALSLGGGVYAAWAESLHLGGTVYTSSVDAVWDYQEEREYIEAGVPARGRPVSPPIPTRNRGTECTSDLEPGQSARTVRFRVSKAHPSYTCEVTLGAHIIGSLPVHITRVEATATDGEGNDVLGSDLEVGVALASRMPDTESPSGFRCDRDAPLDIGAQLHNGDRFCAIVGLHLNPRSRMNHTYNAAVRVELTQWNLSN